MAKKPAAPVATPSPVVDSSAKDRFRALALTLLGEENSRRGRPRAAVVRKDGTVVTPPRSALTLSTLAAELEAGTASPKVFNRLAGFAIGHLVREIA